MTGWVRNELKMGTLGNISNTRAFLYDSIKREDFWCLPPPAAYYHPTPRLLAQVVIS